MKAGSPYPGLLPAEALIKTSAVDHADWNYKGGLAWLQRKRFSLLYSLLRDRHHERLLEIGYGSGVMMPGLKYRCSELYGIDLHTRHREVGEILSKYGVRATLATGSVTALPFDDAFFDCAVTVSALEYVEDIDAACSELERVLTPDGVLCVVTPGCSPLLDLALKATTGEDARENYGDRRQRLTATLGKHFRVEEQRVFPRFLGALLPVYRAVRLRTQ